MIQSWIDKEKKKKKPYSLVVIHWFTIADWFYTSRQNIGLNYHNPTLLKK